MKIDRGSIERLCLTAMLAIMTFTNTGAQPPGMTRVDGKHFYASGQAFVPNGVNYYPQKTPWQIFWPTYDSNIVRKDLMLIRRLGFNIVRIFIGDMDLKDEKSTTRNMGKWRNFLDLSQKMGLKVIVTLFDFMGDYPSKMNPATIAQLRLLFTSFCSNTAIFAWDIKNEPDLDFQKDSARVLRWLDGVIEQARTYDTCHLLTIGWAHPEHATLLADKVDFVSFHSYRRPDSLDEDLTKLLSLAAGKPVVLEEFGASTYAGPEDSRTAREVRQARYFSAVRDILRQHGDIPWLVWTLYDFSEEIVPAPGRSDIIRAEQSRFGILRSDGSLKRGAAALRH